MKLGVTEELKKTMDFKLSTDLVDPVEYVIREGRTEQLTIVFLRRRCSRGGRGEGGTGVCRYVSVITHGPII